MDNVAKKILLLGLGIGATTKEKIEKLIEELEKKGELSAKEGEKITQEFIKKSKKQSEDIKKMVDTELSATIKKMPFATKTDIKALERKIEKISKEIKAC
ncbi:MAG: hypothetical protein KAQ92_06640, partial [Candidatus Aenigmarchaeota archaeon]|nr:hypothetical protein [Candidatus Aenigmarchaeota archaeon]